VNRLDKLYQENPDAAAFADGYLNYLNEVLRRIDVASIARFIELLWDARARGATIFFIGNGGSAATASHFANDLALGTRTAGLPFRVVSLCDNTAVMTAIGNDFGYEDLFVRQLAVLAKAGDLVVAISVSGNSPNVTKALEYAALHDLVTVGLTGFDGGQVRRLASHCVHVPTNAGEYGPAEDAHMVLDHLVGAYLASRCRAEAEGPAS